MKKTISVFLAILMALSSLTFAPISAFAAIKGEFQSVKNPLYSGTLEDFDAKKLRTADWITSIAIDLRDDFVLRQNDIEFSFTSEVLTTGIMQDFVEALCFYACDDSISQSSVDGDYIRWQISSYRGGYSYDYTTSTYEVYLTMDYYDTAQEEQILESKIKSYLSSLDLNSYSDYELLTEFHDYVLNSCDYNFGDMEHEHNYSAYGALCEGKAVCQGYALAFYRLCKEVGLDARIVTSDPDEGCHAWNLVWAGDAYYYVDCTWDDTDDLPDKYSYFLVDYITLQKDDSNFEHKLFADIYNNDYFYNNYAKYVSDYCFDSTSKNIANCDIIVDPTNYNNFVVKSNDGAVLTNDVDYTVSAGTESFAIIQGLGEYSGTASLRDLSINYMTAYLSGANFAYTGQEIVPYVDIPGLTPNVDYKAIATNNINVGTADLMVVGMGRYSGVIRSQFTISQRDINSCNMRLSYNQAYYDGSTKSPSVTVDGLEYGKDYYVSYNPAVLGTGYVYVSGVGNFYGTAVLSYQVVKRSIPTQSIYLLEDNFKYDGKAKKPKVYIPGLVEGQDYALSYSNNTKPGTAVIIVRGINFYGGEAVVNFKILPKPVKKPAKVKLKKLKTAKKSIVVYWNKVSSISGYQVEYATNSKFKKAKRVTVSSKKATSKKITKLKKRKKYYVRVRAYKTVNGKKYYGSWSTKKSIVCK